MKDKVLYVPCGHMTRAPVITIFAPPVSCAWLHLAHTRNSVNRLILTPICQTSITVPQSTVCYDVVYSTHNEIGDTLTLELELSVSLVPSNFTSSPYSGAPLLS